MAKEWSLKEGIEILAYCLMTNHVHLIAIPKSNNSFDRGIGELHRRYAQRINSRKGWRGHLWQERFHSYPMDQSHLYNAVRYVELNPVRAKIASSPDKYLWSSARARLGFSDLLLSQESKFRVSNWHDYWNQVPTETEIKKIELHSRTGRPIGSEDFISNLEEMTGRSLRPKRAGRKSFLK